MKNKKNNSLINQNTLKTFFIVFILFALVFLLNTNNVKAEIDVSECNLEPYCNDGTKYSSCSIDKPLFCDKGKLINNCSTCGCSEGEECQEDSSCKPPFQE